MNIVYNYAIKKRVIDMSEIEFKIERVEYKNRNIRFEKGLLEEGQRIAQEENISFNELVNQSLRFAFKHRKQ